VKLENVVPLKVPESPCAASADIACPLPLVIYENKPLENILDLDIINSISICVMLPAENPENMLAPVTMLVELAPYSPVVVSLPVVDPVN
jgi:hypothetical protein